MLEPDPPEFRRRALDLLESGWAVRDVAASLGFAEFCLHRWKRQDLIERGRKSPCSEAIESAALAEARARIGHLHYFNKDTALASLQDTGYQIVDWFYTPSGDRNPSFKAKLARWPRRLLSRLSPDFAVRLLGGQSLLVLTR